MGKWVSLNKKDTHFLCADDKTGERVLVTHKNMSICSQRRKTDMVNDDNVERLKRYGEEFDQFLDIQFEKGVKYENAVAAYEDFKNYYDKRLKAAGQAGKRIITDEYDGFS